MIKNIIGYIKNYYDEQIRHKGHKIFRLKKDIKQWIVIKIVGDRMCLMNCVISLLNGNGRIQSGVKGNDVKPNFLIYKVHVMGEPIKVSECYATDMYVIKDREQYYKDIAKMKNEK
jgi:hypothetical protein